MDCGGCGNSGGQAASSAGLTPREEQVVRMAADGLSSKEIARALGIAKRTVDGHFGHARKRAAAKTRTELVAMVLSQAADPGDDLAAAGPDDVASPGRQDVKAAEPRAGSCPENSPFPDKINQIADVPSDDVRSHGRVHRGRPTVITPEVIDAIRALRRTHTLKAIAQKTGISRSTLYVHLHEVTDVLHVTQAQE